MKRKPESIKIKFKKEDKFKNDHNEENENKKGASK